MGEAGQNVKEFCDRRPASLNLRYTNGKWQAQLVALDGTFSATAYQDTLEQVLDELQAKVPA